MFVPKLRFLPFILLLIAGFNVYQSKAFKMDGRESTNCPYILPCPKPGPLYCPDECPSTFYSNSNGYICTPDCATASRCFANCSVNPFDWEPREVTACNSQTRCNAVFLCPNECPSFTKANSNGKVCYMDCNSPKCDTECRPSKPNCDGPGSACHDPRFIGGDGIVFYFHGKSNGNYSLVSDTNLQINARFIGHRPAGRTRDFTWIQALGILFKSHTITIEAKKAAIWDNEIDRLKFTYNGQDLAIPEDSTMPFQTPDRDIKLRRTSSKNSVKLTIDHVTEALVNVVPISKEDERVHNYRLPYNDRFAHLEVQFRFFNLTRRVEGVLGRTYQDDFDNPAKVGVAMPVLGGEAKYRTPSLVSPDCELCLFSKEISNNESVQEGVLQTRPGVLDCSH